MFRTSLPPDVGNARAARQFVVQALTSLHCSHLEDTASLLTSEVVTNAIVHANTLIEVRVDSSGPGRVRVEVEDHHPQRPDAHLAAPDDENGRGLGMVELLASAWGIDPPDAPGTGKTVWFELVE